MAKVLIGCRLPNGLVLHHPDKQRRNISVVLDGAKNAKIIGSGFALTEVDAEFWEVWKTAYRDYSALKNGAIFEAASVKQAEDKGKELRNEKTGFEPMKKDAGGVKPVE